MSQDLRLYSFSLMIMLMLWIAPGRAEYGDGTTGCPLLAVPIQLNDDDIWGSHDDDGYSSDDYRQLYPYGNTTATIDPGEDYDMGECTIEAGSGTYYDGANHLWVLDDDLTCEMWGEDGDFRAGLADY